MAGGEAIKGLGPDTSPAAPIAGHSFRDTKSPVDGEDWHHANGAGTIQPLGPDTTRGKTVADVSVLEGG